MCEDLLFSSEQVGEKAVLFLEDKAELCLFMREARNCAALDTGCTSSVAGKPWL